LLFAPGSRPTAVVMRQVLASSEMAGTSARINHCPGDAEGWLEILASGLTFDLCGLAPADPVEPPEAPRSYGFAEGSPDGPHEAIDLAPGAHIASGGRLAPVYGEMAGLAANLVLNLPVAAVVWHTAGTCMEPRYFARTVLNWRAGGAFPALGLTALLAACDGSVASEGLVHFTGQEIQLAGASDESQADTVKLAMRVIDYLVRAGSLTEAREISGAGITLLAEPSQYSDRVWIWRKD
jgi:hypothetical protein